MLVDGIGWWQGGAQEIREPPPPTVYGMSTFWEFSLWKDIVIINWLEVIKASSSFQILLVSVLRKLPLNKTELTSE